MDFYLEDRRQVPAPSAPKRGQVTIDLPLSVGAKVLLLNELLRQQMEARRTGTTHELRPQEVNRLTDLHHPTKIDTISLAPLAIGKKARVEPYLTKAVRGRIGFSVDTPGAWGKRDRRGERCAFNTSRSLCLVGHL